MISGLYTAGWSMQTDIKKMDFITNNLANAGTNGFKRDTVVFQTFPEVLMSITNDEGQGTNPEGRLGKISFGNDIGEVFTDYTEGPIQKTDSKLDAAIRDDKSAFFTVAVPDGQGGYTEYYTRDGSFSLNQGSQLVNADGYAVLGQNGPIVLAGDSFEIKDDGTIFENGVYKDKLLIKQFDDTRTLQKYGMNLVSKTSATNEVPFTGSVTQGYLERSNVNIVAEMVNMINAVRAYETNQKLLQFQDGTLDKVVNEVGAVR